MANRIIKNTESTDYPVWFIVTGASRPVVYAGPWFSREAAEVHLSAKRNNYPRGAYVYCASGHMSGDYRRLCETGRVDGVDRG